MGDEANTIITVIGKGWMKAAKYQLLLAYEAGQCPAEAPESKYPAFNNNISFTYRFKCLWYEFIVMITKPNNKVENGLKIETRRYRLTTSFVRRFLKNI